MFLYFHFWTASKCSNLSWLSEFEFDIFVNMINAALYIDETKNKGRGVFSHKKIPAHTVIEIAPVIVMSAEERVLLDKTLLHDYIFEWGTDSKQCCMALGWVPVYNHSPKSNCEYEMNFKDRTISIKTIREIAADEEIFINYNGDWNNKKGVWFEAK